MAAERFSLDEPQNIIPPYVTAYATSKIDVRGAVFHDRAIFLVKERGDGLWTLPGGWADVNEAPSTAVAREVVVETTAVAFFQRIRHCSPTPASRQHGCSSSSAHDILSGQHRLIEGAI
jgi:8-oxo-dGTP pyrophosphatase MutT (NUDIX family)